MDNKEGHAVVPSDVPVRLKCSGIETRLILTNGDPAPLRQASTATLQRALRMAFLRKQQLLAGKVETMAEFAKKEGITQHFLAHRIQLAN